MGVQLNRGQGRSKSEAAAFGRRAEGWAALYLRLKGYAVLARGRKAKGAGEIDIIAKKGKLVAFIEVKARARLEDAAAAIGPVQRSRLIRGAEAFLAAHPKLAACQLRFDAILVAPGRWPRHLIDAWRVAE